MNGPNAVLLLSCPDQKGLVANISNFIFQQNGNIVHAAQHTSIRKKIFFMRIEWELDGFNIPRDEIGDVFKHTARKFDMTWSLHFTDTVPRMAVFASRHPHCLYDLMLRHRMGEFRAEIPLVIGNHEELRSLVEPFGLRFECFPITPETKSRQEAKEITLLKKEKIDVIVLARYMQILSGKFVREYPNRIINIHHSFLPAFAGPKPYQQAYDRGVKIIGATSHYVTQKLDDGPIIAQDVIKISHRDSVEDIQLKSQDLERIVLARAVRLHLENRILPYGSKTVVFEQAPSVMNRGPDFVHLCQPGAQSCGACCGIYNYADSTRESLVRRFRRRTTLYRRLAGPDFDPETFSRLVLQEEDPTKRYEVIYCCEFVGFLNEEETQVGCLLHPMQNEGRDLRDASFYGRELCDGHFCPSYTYLAPAEQRALVDLLDDWYLFGLCVTDIDFSKEYFRLISERVGRMPPPEAFREGPTREKALAYFELKLNWPFRSPDVNRLGKYYFDGSQYMISFIDYDALGCERSPFDRIFLSLSSELRTADDLRQAEAIIESHIETFARAFGGAA